jgi:hypothetical protein
LANSTLVPFRVNELEVMLPVGSALAQRNTEDARYWVWSTPIGQVSVTWVSQIARRLRLEAMSPDTCRVGSDRLTFAVDWMRGEMTAVSEPLTANGAGLLVRIEAAPPGIEREEAVQLLRHVRVVRGVEEESWIR